MKKTAFILFLLLIIQNNTFSQFNYTFKKIIDLNGFECNIGGIKQTSDLGYVICGYYQNLINSTIVNKGFLIKLNKSGSIVWYKESEAFINLAIDDFDNIYTIANGKSLVDTTYGDIIILKTNSLGNLIWAKSFGDINGSEGVNSIDVSGSDVYVGGNTEYGGTLPIKAYILKINSSGNMLWNKAIYDSLGFQFSFIKKIYDDRIILVGFDGHGKGNIVVFSKNGNVLCSKKINYNDQTLFYSATSYKNNGYLISGSTASFSGPSNLHPFLLALDSAYNLIWAKKYSLLGTNISEFININKTSDGNYIVTYEPENINGKSHLFGLIKLDTNGEQIWGKLYSQTEEIMPSNLIETKDSGFAVVGYIQDNYVKYPYILKTDKNGLTDSCENDSLISITYQNIVPSFSSFGIFNSLGIASNTIYDFYNSFRSDSLFCLDSIIDLTYVFKPNIDTTQSSISVPNIFTPNNDGVNDDFKITSKNIVTLNCKIYNRWGIKITELTKPNEVWEGHSTSGLQASEGVYFYMLSATGADGNGYDKKGFVQLIR